MRRLHLSKSTMWSCLLVALVFACDGGGDKNKELNSGSGGGDGDSAQSMDGSIAEDAASNQGDASSHADAQVPTDGGSSQPDGASANPGCMQGKPPDIMLVVDRSASMVNGSSPRWQYVVDGLSTVLAETDATTRFGLMLFPGAMGAPPQQEDCSKYPAATLDWITCTVNNGQAQDCRTGDLEVPIGASSRVAILAAMEARTPMGNTPTAATLTAALAALTGTVHPTRVVLVTDGEPNCQGTKETSTESVQALTDAGFQTYVLGVGVDPADTSIVTAFNKLAAAGGTGETTFREVDSAESLAENIRTLLTPVDCGP